MEKTRKTNKINHRGSDRMLNTTIVAGLCIFLLIILYPLVYVLSSSFSSGAAVTGGRVLLWPVDFSMEGYKVVFAYRNVWVGYANTIFYTVVGTVINLILTILCAYPLSRKNFQWRNFYMTVYMIPMFFGGGLIPTYLLMTSLHLTNTRWAILLSGALSIYNMVIMRTFFQNSIPGELLEAAKIDGVSDIGYLFRILLPLSKAIIAVISLYYAVGHWNSYFTALIYLRDTKMQPLQLILRDILNSARIDMEQIENMEEMAQRIGIADVMKYALVVVATVPILVAYPFVQKFFEKGVMIGSVKS